MSLLFIMLVKFCRDFLDVPKESFSNNADVHVVVLALVFTFFVYDAVIFVKWLIKNTIK